MAEAQSVVAANNKDAWRLGPIFDADAHIDPPHDMWKDYLPSHLKEAAASPQLTT